MEIGAQLYTLREYCKTIEDFAETLKKVADIGYRTVQVSGVCAYEPEWLDEQLKANGLRCVITHTNQERIKTETEAVIADHDKFNCKYIGIGSIPYPLTDDESYDMFVKDYLEPAKKIAASGKYLMYHNHHAEFMKNPKTGNLYIEDMAADFAPNELGFTLDTYWVQVGGGNPVEWINKLSGRLPCIHLKDLAIAKNPEGGVKQHMAVVGEGNINFEAVIEAAEKAGTDYLLVEQDNCYGENPFDCLERSYKNLIKLGLR